MEPVIRWSIIVCTHNRAQDLRQNLPRLKQLDYPADRCEILVVDNASSDDSAEAAAAAGVPCLREERLGLSHARNRGIEAARGELIAFIDDDAWPEPDWLTELEKGFTDDRVACAGGKVVPDWEGDRNDWPEWIHPLLYAQFSVTAYGDTAHKTRYPRIPSGTNIAFRKSALATVGGFRPDLGRSGTCLISGEEGEMCLRVERAGYDIAYLPGAVIHHLIPGKRLTREWLLDRSHWQGISSAIVERSALDRGALFRRAMRCRALLAAAAVVSPVAAAVGNERLKFLCACQQALWRAYLGEVGRDRGRDR